MITSNSFIKWTSNDDNGKFFIVGQVKMVKNDTIIFEDEEGLMYGIPKDDGQLESIKKPKNWNRPKSVVSEVPKTKPKKIKKASGGKTKIDQVIDLLRANKDLINNRKAAIEKIVTEVGMTPAGASTYFAKAKKAVV